jgi:hypothetical protein
LRFATLRDLCWIMADKSLPERTLERKKREAAALKANMKKRKAQVDQGSSSSKPEKPATKTRAADQ